MQKLGQLDMHFEALKDGVFYYHVDLVLDGTTRAIALPRYHSMIGWIEVFGLPPQFEWVILEDVEPFEKHATLEIDGKQFAEHFSYEPRPAAKQHHITISREGAGVREEVTYAEDYTNAPDEITATTTIKHNEGTFVCEIKKQLLAVESIPSELREQAAEVLDERGTPDQAWVKRFSCSGEKPLIYYGHFFPELAGVDVINTSGVSLELGYLKSGDAVAAVHGDWYKWFQFGDQRFHIFESNFSSTTIETPDGPQAIKDTYRKELFSIG